MSGPLEDRLASLTRRCSWRLDGFEAGVTERKGGEVWFRMDFQFISGIKGSLADTNLMRLLSRVEEAGRSPLASARKGPSTSSTS